MVKYDQQVSRLIARLQEQSKVRLISPSASQSISCSACNCESEEHDYYIYCGLIDGYLCRVCCCYDLYNDYQLVNDLLAAEVFAGVEEVQMLCDEYCSAEWEER